MGAQNNCATMQGAVDIRKAALAEMLKIQKSTRLTQLLSVLKLCKL